MKRKRAFRIKGEGQSVIAGTVSGIIITLCCILLLSGLLVKYDIMPSAVKYLLFIPSVIAGLSAGLITGKFVRSKGFLWGAAAAFAVSLILELILLFVNSFNVNLLVILLIPVYTFFGSLGGIIASNLK